MTGPVFSRATPGEIYKLRLANNAAGLAGLLEAPEALTSAKLREDIAFALSQVNDLTPALPVLRRLASADPDRNVRLFAVAALAGSGDRDSIAIFGAALSDPDPNVQLHAIKGLEGSRTDDAVRLLIPALNDRRAIVRARAARALAVLGDPAAIRPLEQTYRRTLWPFARVYLKKQLRDLRERCAV